jgi:YD repeat-containing protein
MTAKDDRAPSPMQAGDMYSTAFQFYSHINADVDPRTGMYTASIDLATGEGNHLRGPHLPFRLSYNPLDTVDDGFGEGWRLGLTQLDLETMLLSLSSGDSHKIDSYELDRPARFPDRKLDSCSLIKRDSRGRSAVVEHITGVVEYLETNASPYLLLRPVRIVNPSGDALTLKWTANSGGPRLENVTDDDGNVLLRVVYVSSASVVLTLHLGGSIPIEMHFSISGGKLQNVSIPLTTELNAEETTAGDEAVWAFAYTDEDGMHLLRSVTSPDGIQDTVVYDREALKLPDRAPREYFPAVSSRVRQLSANAATVIQDSRYTYDAHQENNFFGYPRVRTWENRNDQLLHMSGVDAFSYGSKEVQRDGASELCTIERKYNHFHLITDEWTTRGTVVQHVETQYGTLPETSYENQPASFQLPHKVTTTCYDKAAPDIRQVTVTESTYDDYGNVTRRVDSATGIIETSVYYPPEGETDAEGIVLCPADPLGKVRRLKSRTSSPGENDGPVRSTQYRYTEVPVRDATRDKVQRVVNRIEKAATKVVSAGLAKTIAVAVGNIIRKIGRRANQRPQARTYYIQASDELSTVIEGNTEQVLVHSRQSFVTDFGDQHGSLATETRTQDGLTETRLFAYVSDAAEGTVTTKTTHHTHDSPPVVNTTSETLQLISGLVWATVDALGNRTEFAYDALGRRISEVISPDVEEYRVKTSWRYQLSRSERWVERIGITGLPHRVWMDEQGRTVRRDEPLDDPAHTLVTVHELEYDGFGQLAREVQTDRLQDDMLLTLETRYTYDDWGRCSKLSAPDGSVTVGETSLVYDPDLYGDDVITRTVQWQTYGADEKTGWRSTDTDAADRQRRAQTGTWSATGDPLVEAATSWRYDGVGRCVAMIDPVKNETKQVWDVYDRLIRTDLPDGSAVLRSYADGHEEELLARLAIVPPGGGAEAELGRRTWDGLGRLMTEKAGSLQYSHEYKAEQMSAASKTMPDASRLEMLYDPLLREALTSSRLMNPDGSLNADITNATYDRRLGVPTLIKAKGGTMTITPDYLGRMTKQGIMLNGDDARQYETFVSPGGLVLQKTGTDGVTQVYGYDDRGRVSTVTDPDIEIVLEYDELSRVSTRTATSPVGNVPDKRSIIQGMRYDALGRVVEQRWEHVDATGTTARRLALTWREDDKVAERRWYQADGIDPVRTESMEYDSRGRLVVHRIAAASGEHPVDEMHEPYVLQTFSHDHLDNLLSVTTTRVDEKKNITTYGYDPTDIDRLVSVSNSLAGYPGDVTPLRLEYDANGNLIDDGQGRTLFWDGAGRLESVTPTDKIPVTYTHGPDGRVSNVTRGAQSTFRYREDGAIAFEFEVDTTASPEHREGRRYIRAGGGVVAETLLAGVIRRTLLLGTDPQGSVVTESGPGETA